MKPSKDHGEPALPSVLLDVSGDVFRAGGSTPDGVGWDIYAEAEGSGEEKERARTRVLVGGAQVADITVHAPYPVLVEETQAVAAALVWSAIRSVRIRRHEETIRREATRPALEAPWAWSEGAPCAAATVVEPWLECWCSPLDGGVMHSDGTPRSVIEAVIQVAEILGFRRSHNPPTPIPQSSDDSEAAP